jgi:putative addiction module component (TIGR02574 family)
MKAITHDELIRLSPQVRLVLIEQIWDSLDETAIPLPNIQKDGLTRWLVLLDDDLQQFMTWKQLRTELARHCP